MMKTLVTGFEPFLENRENISQKIIESIRDQEKLKQREIETLLLPVEFEKAFLKLSEKFKDHQYDFIFLLGLAANRTKISLEKVGLNWTESRQPDNAGVIPRTGFIFTQSEKAIFSKMPWTEVQTSLDSREVEVSFSAGTYVCNDLYFRTLDYFTRHPEIQTKVGFIHLPPPGAAWSEKKIEQIVLKIMSLSGALSD